MKVCVLFNPRSGSAEQIAPLRESLGPDAVFRELGPDEDYATLAADLAKTCDVLAGAGGDGTINAVVNGLVSAGGQTPLAVLPIGTGNDFARTMAIPLDILRAGELIATARRRPVDVVRVGGSRSGYMVNAA